MTQRPSNEQEADSLSCKDPHATSAEQVLSAMGSRRSGLDANTARKRLDQCGPNQLQARKPTPGWLRLLRQFQNLFIYVLLVSAVISYLLGHYVDSGVIFAVVLINALVGFIQEGKAEAALRAILSMTKTHCRVLREDTVQTIDSTEVVPGDIIILKSGDRVAADMRIIESKELRSDESMLTGESQPRDKNPEPLQQDIDLADRNNMAFMGTMVVNGTGKGVVTNTATTTQLGNINTMVQQVSIAKTPLQKQLEDLARKLTIAILLFSAATMAYGMLVYNQSFSAMIQAAIGIAVAAIPEGLPAVVTIVLALGVQRMAHRNALMRRLPAVEVLGSVDVICTDKTGTLTANTMMVTALQTATDKFEISGSGYAPDGDLCKDGHTVAADAQSESLKQAALIAMLCNEARITCEHQHWKMHGDPTEGALHVMALKSQLSAPDVKARWPRLDTLPFATEKRYMATLHTSPEGDHVVLVKGAPERILGFCSKQLDEQQNLQPLNEKFWQEKTEELASQGMRVIALARKTTSAKTELQAADAETDLIMIALSGISDPPREEAIAAIAECHRAGIRVKMITGDNPLTAAAIGRQLGINDARILTGHDLDNTKAEDMAQLVDEVDIYARTSPKNKLMLVKNLQQNRHVVAMTGDGVNDAPSLKQADIGIAMGLKGTDAAREAADFVLTDDNFATIASAVAEGRTVYDNTVKSILFMLPVNVAQATVILIAILLGRVLPISPPQILWVNMITSVTLSLALAFEAGERHIMQRPPRPYEQSFFTPTMLRRLFIVSAAGAAIVFLMFTWSMNRGDSIEYARSVAINSLVAFEAFYLISSRFLYQSIFRRETLKGAQPALIAIALVIGAQILFTYLPWSQGIFEVEGLQLRDWLIIIPIASSIIFIVELDKYIDRRTGKF